MLSIKTGHILQTRSRLAVANFEVKSTLP